MSGFPRACLLHRSLNFFRSRCYDVSRRLITPRRKYSCTFMAHAYVKFQCRRSSSSSLPSSFTSSLHYPHPSCNAHSLIPVGMYIYIYNVRAIKTFVFYILVGKVGGPDGIYVINKAFSTVRLFFFQEYFPKIGLNRLSLLFCRFDNAMIIEKGIGIRNKISLFTRAFYGFLM